MRRSLHRLTAIAIKSKSAPGLYADGGGLYLRVAPGGSKSWVYIFQWRTKRRELGLGGADSVTLGRAREKAAAARAMVADGIDPIAAKKSEKAIPTFGELADEFIRNRSAAVRSDKSVARWKRAIGPNGYAEPLRDKRVSDVATDDIIGVLQPIWHEKAETAAMLRGYLEAVIDMARSKGHFPAENPARWRGHLEHLLSARARRQKHHAAIGWREMPAFMIPLRSRAATAARGLEFLILCASRSGEVRLATRREFDLDAALWSIPGERMKSGKPHRVPLSTTAVELVRPLLVALRPDDYVFRGAKPGQPLSLMGFEMLMRRMDRTETTHGFRSAFRDWAGDETTHSREVAEAALAHTIGSEAERAYRRGDALEKRRALMQAWADFLAPAASAAAMESPSEFEIPTLRAKRGERGQNPKQVKLFGGR